MTRCRALIGGFGVPTQRDLDFGRQVIRYLEPFTWPDGVVVESLSFAAHLVLHRLHELDPPKLVLVGAAGSGEDPPGTVRRRRVDRTAPTPAAVQRSVAASVSGAVDLGHTLDVLRRFGGLPEDTVLIEVEPADCSFGLGFSEDLAASFDTIVDMIREEVGSAPEIEPLPPPPSSHALAVDGVVAYAGKREEARFHERDRGGLAPPWEPERDGIEVASRSKPWAIGLDRGSDWYDVIPLAEDRLAVVMGDAPGRGVDAAALKADLRVAVHAYAALYGDQPRAVVECLDRLVSGAGRGQTATVLYLTLDTATGDMRMCSAGHCPPLLLPAGRYLHEDFAPALGAEHATDPRDEITARLEPGETLVLFTDGLVERPNRPLALGLLELAEAAAGGPFSDPAVLCDRLIGACVDRRRRGDDLSVLALRRT